MADFVVVAILAVVIGAALRYIYKAKKNGAKCIGCSMSGCCSAKSCGGCKGETSKEVPACRGGDAEE